MRLSREMRWAVGTSLGVLGVYLLTLAPSVTFWDAGELITASRTLGIPHPPGTPLFTLLAHTWGMLLPVGDYAWRLNLLSAVSASLAALCWFLVAHDAVTRLEGDNDPTAGTSLALAAGIAAALLTAFGFTTWQNSTETEVYSVAMLLVAIVALIATRWRTARHTEHGHRLLLLALYAGAMSVGNHLLALLVGPALVALLAAEALASPLSAQDARRQEWARIAVVAAVWLLLIALGLGSSALTLVAGAVTLVAIGVALRRRQGAFAALAILIAVVGVSTYLFLLLRARQQPWINEADPSHWDALLGVIRRAQYPVRTPLDDPTVLHGAGNPGRTLTLFGYQLANYAQYFDWQWAKSIGPTVPTSPLRVLVTLLFAGAGSYGAVRQFRRDRPGFTLLAMLFVVTGLGLVIYMDFKPGPSIGWNRWSAVEDHEVRERDYFFVASFVAWGVWAAIGLATLAGRLVRRAGGRRFAPGYAVLLIAAFPMLFNLPAARRRGNSDETFARDFSRALLESVPPGGILFTFGDNDTFPLWHAQAVDGIRRDVTIVCLALAETPWYMRQLREMTPDPVNRTTIAAVWRETPAMTSPPPLHDMTDDAIGQFTPFLTSQELMVPLANGLSARVAKGEPIYGKDLMVLQILRQNVGKRPVAWSITAASRLYGLEPALVMQGLVLVLPVTPVDREHLSPGIVEGEGRVLVDLETTRRLAMESWSFGKLTERGVAGLDPSDAAMAAAVAVPLLQAGVGYYLHGDTTSAVALLERADRLSRDSTARSVLRVLRAPAPAQTP